MKYFTALFAVLLLTGMSAAAIGYEDPDEDGNQLTAMEDPEEDIPGQDVDDVPESAISVPDVASDTAQQVTGTVSDAVGQGVDAVRGLGDSLSDLLGMGNEAETPEE